MAIVLSLIIIFLDQITKTYAISSLKGSPARVIIPNWLKFTYVENYGAAFGILKDRKMFFILITLLVVVIVSFFLFRYYHKMNNFSKIGFALLLAGAVGNLIDRIRFGYVVDFISVRLFNVYDYPVFNIADISIVLGTIMMVILILFEKESI